MEINVPDIHHDIEVLRALTILKKEILIARIIVYMFDMLMKRNLL